MNTLPLIIVLLSLSFLTAYILKTSNKLSKLKNQYVVRFGEIEKLFYRRYELIQSIANTVRAYLADETSLQKLLESRDLAIKMVHQAAEKPNIATLDQVIAAEAILERELSHLFAVISQIDHLKHNQSIRWLQDEIALTAKNIELAKQPFNKAVAEYNQYRTSFPSTFLAPNIGHTLNAAALT